MFGPMQVCTALAVLSGFDDDFRGGSGLGLSIVKRVVDHLRWGVQHEPT